MNVRELFLCAVIGIMSLCLFFCHKNEPEKDIFYQCLGVVKAGHKAYLERNDISFSCIIPGIESPKKRNPN